MHIYKIPYFCFSNSPAKFCKVVLHGTRLLLKKERDVGNTQQKPHWRAQSAYKPKL